MDDPLGKYFLSAMFSDIHILNINKVGSKLALQGGKSHVVFCGLLLFLCTKTVNLRLKIYGFYPFLHSICLEFPIIRLLMFRRALKGLIFGLFRQKIQKSVTEFLRGSAPLCYWVVSGWFLSSCWGMGDQ